MNVVRIGDIVTPSAGPTEGLTGDVVATFARGSSATVAWRKDRPALQYNVGTRWLRILEDEPGRALPHPLTAACSSCGGEFLEWTPESNQYGRCAACLSAGDSCPDTSQP